MHIRGLKRTCHGSKEKIPRAALDQINQKGYAEKYRLDGRPVTKVGIAFSSEERNITDCQAVPLELRIKSEE